MNSLPIKGLQKTSLIDFQPYVASTIFLGHCNFRCPYCHNKDLVLNPDTLKNIEVKKVLETLKTKQKILDGVCITGGEPTIQPGLEQLITEIKKLGLKIKIDTNGSNPEIMKKLFEKGLIDYIALDIKSDKGGYKNATRVEFDIKKLEKTIEILKASKVMHEYRTTVVPGLFSKKTAENIGEWLGGSTPYYLQNFIPQNTIDDSYKNQKPFNKQDLKEFKGVLKQYFTTVEFR